MESTERTNEAAESWAERLPAVNYFEKAIDLAAAYDRLLVSLYSALIAGIVVLLLHEEVSLWVGGALFAALCFFVMGIGHTLLHMAFTTKLLLLAEALVKGTDIVPNAIEDEEPTVEAYARNQAYAQRSYSSQLFYLLFGMSFGAVAVVIRLWEYAWRAGVIGLATLMLLLVIVTLAVTWKRTLRRFPPSLAKRKARNGISEETN